MALVHFARRGVQFAVLEVGLGGRLDSTNVCHPAVGVITSISFDHTRQLGSTLVEIAREKAGIVKSGVPLVSGVVEVEPRTEIEQTCSRCDSRLIQLGRDFDFVYTPPSSLENQPAQGRIDYRGCIDGRSRFRSKVSLALLGRHQGANAAVALATLDELEARGWPLPEGAIRRGLAGVRWPARIEVVHRRPTIVIDSAHNVASIRALLTTLDESFTTIGRKRLVFATTRDKATRGMLELLLAWFDEVVFTRYQSNPRSVPPGELAELAADLRGRRCQICPDPVTAWEAVGQQVAENDLICITGSVFIAAEMSMQVNRQPIEMVRSCMPALAGQTF
jgi:dihydrofolate synthase/folylpolyglutamate synthase